MSRCMFYRSVELCAREFVLATCTQYGSMPLFSFVSQAELEGNVKGHHRKTYILGRSYLFLSRAIPSDMHPHVVATGSTMV